MAQKTDAPLQSRSRKGCVTCRIRRVKCDEERPSCRRCRSTGRKCDGYLPEAEPRRSSSKSIHFIQHTPQLPHAPQIMTMMPSLDKLVSEDESRSLEFFHIQTASCFGSRAGAFLLRAAHHDPSIRLAAMALGSLHRVFLYDNHSDPELRLRGTRLALQQYNSAIRRGLSQFPNNGDGPTDVVLTMCLLFFCFESLQGHFRVALQHVASGLRILKQQQSRGTHDGSVTYIPPDVIRSMFAILESQLLEFDVGSPIPDELRPTMSASQQSPVAQPSRPLCTLDDFGDSFRSLYNRFLWLLSFAERLEEDAISEFEVSTALEHIQALYFQLQRDTDAWSIEFERFLKTHPLEATTADAQKSIKTLQMWRLTMCMTLQMEWPPSEAGWDQHLSSCTTIVSLAEEILNMTTPVEFHEPRHNVGNYYRRDYASRSLSPDSPTTSSPPSPNSPNSPNSTSYATILPKPRKPSPSSFSVSLGILPPLWIVATKCRHSNTRYRAIDSIFRSRRREGVWDSDLYFRLAMKNARIEEQAAGLEECAEYEPADIALHARVTTLAGQFGEGREGKVKFFRQGVELVEEALSW